ARAGASSSPERSQERQQIGDVGPGQLGVEPLGHDRDATLLEVLDLIARDADRDGVRPVQEDRADGLAFQRAGVQAAVARGDQIRLEAPDEAGAGEDDGLEQVPAGADGADLAEVGADAAAFRDDPVAGRAGGRPAEEYGAPPRGVAGA